MRERRSGRAAHRRRWGSPGRTRCGGRKRRATRWRCAPRTVRHRAGPPRNATSACLKPFECAGGSSALMWRADSGGARSRRTGDCSRSSPPGPTDAWYPPKPACQATMFSDNGARVRVRSGARARVQESLAKCSSWAWAPRTGHGDKGTQDTARRRTPGTFVYINIKPYRQNSRIQLQLPLMLNGSRSPSYHYM